MRITRRLYICPHTLAEGFDESESEYMCITRRLYICPRTTLYLASARSYLRQVRSHAYGRMPSLNVYSKDHSSFYLRVPTIFDSRETQTPYRQMLTYADVC
jgi:hypothetical protein